MQTFLKKEEGSAYVSTTNSMSVSYTHLTDGQGEIRNSYQYDAFGIRLETTEQLNNRIRYTGQQYDDCILYTSEME